LRHCRLCIAWVREEGVLEEKEHCRLCIPWMREEDVLEEKEHCRLCIPWVREEGVLEEKEQSVLWVTRTANICSVGVSGEGVVVSRVGQVAAVWDICTLRFWSPASFVKKDCISIASDKLFKKRSEFYINSYIISNYTSIHISCISSFPINLYHRHRAPRCEASELHHQRG